MPSSLSSTSSNSPEPSVAPKWQFWKKSKVTPKPDEESKYPPLPYWSLFRYSTLSERILMGISIFAAIIHGSLLPILTVLFGRVIDEFGRLFLDPSDSLLITADEVPNTIEDTTSIYLIIAFVAFAISFIQLFCALTAATSMGNNIRRRFFQSLIAQDADFYDHAESGSLTHLVINDINLIQAGVGDKLATACQYMSTFVCGIIVGFIYSWRLTCVMLAVAPVLLLAGLIFGNASAESTGDGLGAYGRAGAIVSEAIGLIRTVTAFGAQKEEMKRYNSALETAFYSSAKAAVASALGLGSAMMLILFTYGLAMWYGGILVRNHGNSSGDIFLTFFATTLGASSLGTAGPAFKSFTVARAAAPRVFEIIDRISPINPLDDEGGTVPDAPVKGRITFEDVDFNYSTRVVEDGDSSLVLDGFNLDVPVSSSEAFVGQSGCGKSTIGRLLQRSYDPQKGRVLLDGVDLKELNVRWLRSQIGVVAQMPSLFMMSIRENIALGAGLDMSVDKVSGKRVFKRRDVTDEEIVAAAKMANAHDFIKKLPEGYNTMLGERGAMLSGGQKQRVCIARALIRNPKILLLDESTASLDTASERLVQDALEKAASGRTTITIAHRLSTVRHSDAISCIENGKIVERGPHDELLGKQDGYYKRLYDLQNVQRVKLEEEKAQDLEDETDNLMPFASMDEGSTKQDTISKVGVLEEEDEKGTDIDSGLFFRTLKFNSSEWPYIICGTLGAILAGLIWPLASIPLVETIEALTKAVVDTDEVHKGALSFVVLGGMALLGNGLQYGMLGISGELLAKKLRGLAFESLLRQEMGYFDMKENSLGALTGRLSSDAGAVKGLTGDLYGIGMSVVGSLIAGLTISFINCWRVTLVVLAIIPGIALGGYFEMQSSAGIDSSAHKDFAAANSSAAEAVDNMNTVRNLGSEDYFIGRFRDKIWDTIKAKRNKALLMGVAFGFSEFCQYLMWYASFKAGGDFVSAGHCTFKEMLLASMAILFSAITLGNVSVFAPDVAASKIAATHVYRLIDRKSEVDPMNPDGEKMEKIEGRIAVDNVRFEYPRRPDVAVLRGLTLDVSAGKTLALVGTSGHGKSTIIGLLERFYSIRSGKISVDEQDISKTNVQDLRSHIGLVSQEPELFNKSVFDNITYGLAHKEGMPVSMADVEEAAKQANAHEFIEALPQGYDTLVGERGSSLSGGQRQRVAIARSLIRRPSLLLLDEATSALDGASERLVQEALNRAATGRTTIVVAHRLSTIRNADVIAVVRRGKIVESGTHDVLLRRNGAYTKLIENQLSEV